MTSFCAARPSGADAVFATNLSREAQAHAGSGPDGTGAAPPLWRPDSMARVGPARRRSDAGRRSAKKSPNHA